jgi:hypothetical protein
MITLTVEERVKFARWLKQEAAIEVGLAQQLEKLPGPSFGSGAALYRSRAEAKAKVAEYLESGEVQAL